MIAAVAFRNFKALRNASVELGPFNLVLGPNGSGKTSLIEALLHLRGLSKLPPVDDTILLTKTDTPDLTFRFSPPYDEIQVRLGCVDDLACDALHFTPAGSAAWTELRTKLGKVRSYVFDHSAMANPAPHIAHQADELLPNGQNLAAVIATLQERAPASFAALSSEVIRLFPEFSRMEVQSRPENTVALVFTLADGTGRVEGEDVSQGMLYTLAVLALSFLSDPPSILCIEEIDRGIHPRMLREIRDALYRLSYPADFGLTRPAVQVIATTHSPYLLDLFRDHPEEIIISQKHGTVAQFQRLADRKDLPQLLQEGSLGDLWFSGILGGIPEEGLTADVPRP